MNYEALWNLRDARGLNAKEKAFLFVAISRGDELFGTWETNAADMGLSKRGYYDTRDSLLSKDLIRVARKYNGTSVYVVDTEALSRMGNAEADDSRTGNQDSRIGNGGSRLDETKKNTKNNPKKNLKNKNNPTDADAPVGDESSFAKKDSESDFASSNPASPLNPIPRDARTPSPFESRSSAEWRGIRKVRPFTEEEREYINASAREANSARRASAPVDADPW